MGLRRLPAAVALLALLGACAYTAPAPVREDVLAKEFLTHPHASTIYVFRSPVNDVADDALLYVNGRLVGAALPGMYFRLEMVPGRHVLHGSSDDLGQILLDTRPGSLHVISMDVIGSFPRFRLVPDEQGVQRIRECCVLHQAWAVHHRPFALR